MVKTYHNQSTFNHTGSLSPNAFNQDYELTAGSGTNALSGTWNLAFYSPDNEPNLADWPNGTYTWYFKVTLANANISITNVTLYRLNAARTSTLASKSSTVSVPISAVQTYSGTISWSDGTQNPTGRAASDTFALTCQITQVAGHGTQNWTNSYDTPDNTRVDTPLEATGGTPIDMTNSSTLTFANHFITKV